MTLEDTLRAAIQRSGLRHLLLVQDGQGRWQCSTNRHGQGNGFTVVVEADPVKAVEQSLVGWRWSEFPEYVGFGPNGVVPDRERWLMQALDEAITTRRGR
jgi:predicted NodU family carbamoyl transferase